MTKRKRTSVNRGNYKVEFQDNTMFNVEIEKKNKKMTNKAF
jgi:hypothetical protein